MASSGINNGTLVAVYIGGDKVANLTSNGINHEMSPRDATTKDSAGSEEVLEGLMSTTMECEGYFNEASTAEGYAEIYDVWVARTALTLRYSSEVAGDMYYEGSAYVTSISRSDSLEESGTFSVSFKVTGAVTKAAVST